MGPQAKAAVPLLLARLGQDEANPNSFTPATKYVTVAANRTAYTLACVGPDVIPELLKVLKEDGDAQRRRAAVLALGFLGPPARAVVPDLEMEAKTLDEKEEKTRDEEWLAKAIQKALERIRNPQAIPVEKLE
jgi:HEAT repeat protein